MDAEVVMTTTPVAQRPWYRGEVLAWAMYDWANSAFSTLSITIVVLYFKDVLFPEQQFSSLSGSIYAYGLALATIIAAILSPVIGALADATNSKHYWLRGTALTGVVASCLLAMCPVDYPWLAWGIFVVVVIGFELSYGMANAFLNEIASEQELNRVSAFGFALGYIGGALALILTLVLISLGKDWSATSKFQAGIWVMGLWWGVFSLPALLVLKDRPNQHRQGNPQPTSFFQAWRTAISDVKNTIAQISHYKQLGWFLLAYLLYNDCVQTVITQASNFATEDIKFQSEELIYLILMIQFVALPGSLLMGWLSDRIGQRVVLYTCLLTWGAILLSSWFVREKAAFWVMGVAVAIVMGGIQSVSRAIMGTMTPANRSAEFFGFYNLSSKATSFIGPLTFGLVYQATHEYRWAIISLVVQLSLGAFLLLKVDFAAGVAVAKADAMAEE
jgi:MFS transporter, UMF1 family